MSSQKNIESSKGLKQGKKSSSPPLIFDDDEVAVAKEAQAAYPY